MSGGQSAGDAAGAACVGGGRGGEADRAWIGSAGAGAVFRLAGRASAGEYGLFDEVVSAGQLHDRQSYRPYAALDGRVPSGESAAGGSGGNLQCDPAVFQRRLCGGDGFLSWQQRAGILPVASADLSFYGEAGLAAFQRDDDAGDAGRGGGCGKTYGNAGDCAGLFHGGQ